VAVARDPEVLDKWWPEGPNPSKGKYGHLWLALSDHQRTVLQSGTLDEITAAVDQEAKEFPKPPGAEDVSAFGGQAWALVRI
jgi:hypothetical protein